MKMTKVTSSNIESIGYEGGVLAVKFLGGKSESSGGLYHYPGVTKEHYDKLMASQSIGVGFSQHIRASYKGERQKEEKKK